jgi:hypothetical protein
MRDDQWPGHVAIIGSKRTHVKVQLTTNNSQLTTGNSQCLAEMLSESVILSDHNIISPKRLAAKDLAQKFQARSFANTCPC